MNKDMSIHTEPSSPYLVITSLTCSGLAWIVNSFWDSFANFLSNPVIHTIGAELHIWLVNGAAGIGLVAGVLAIFDREKHKKHNRKVKREENDKLPSE